MFLNILPLALVDGVAYACLLFLVSMGLTLIFGVMGILNVAHGAFYAFGGYAAASLIMMVAPATESTWIPLVSLFLVAIVVGTLLGGITYTTYQLVVVPATALIARVGLECFLRYTNLGKQMVAIIHNREVATPLGINASRIGLITGALIAALMIGILRSIAVYMAPEVEVAVPYIIMGLVLLVRPHGLFTVAQARTI